jgi:hypothetical protein
VAPHEISAELDGYSDDPQTLCTLAPRQSIRAHTSAPLVIGESRPGIFAPLTLKPGVHLFTGHAKLLSAAPAERRGLQSRNCYACRRPQEQFSARKSHLRVMAGQLFFEQVLSR